MKKIAYIIPGYCESHLKQRGYNKIGKFFEERGIEVVHVEINWEKNSPERFSDHTAEFLKIYKRPKNSKVYILGFSYGAIVAFLTAAKTKPDALILCSLSPYFKEDHVNLKEGWLLWFREHFTKSDYSFNQLASKIKSKTYLIVGDKEDTSCLIRARNAKKLLLDATVSIAKGAQHKIGGKEYLEEVKKVISKI